ncbi:MAG: hypothetical protein NTZ17_10600 [Phycisphaerae bacterium]|nr:hypothetical protein [Phycisphaerae bacterium]
MARFCGLFALLGTGVLVAVMFVFLTMFGSEGSDAAAKSSTRLLTMIPPILFYGFLALILAEFISYLLVEQGEPKWILRQGDKIIYAYVLYSFAMFIYAAPQAASMGGASGMDFHRVFGFVLFVVSGVVHVLIWVGIAIVLRKVVPIIRESKTLV